MGSDALAIKSIKTMSSAPKLDASALGACSSAASRNKSVAAVAAAAAYFVSNAITRGEAEVAAASGRTVASTEPRHARMRELVAVAEHGEPGERVVGTAIVTDRERVEAALRKVIQLVALNVADRAQFAGEAEALAQQPRDRIAATVGELRKIDRDQRKRRHVGGEGGRIVGRCQPDANVAARGNAHRGALSTPPAARSPAPDAGRVSGDSALRAAASSGSATSSAVFNELRHKRVP